MYFLCDNDILLQLLIESYDGLRGLINRSHTFSLCWSP